MVQTHPALNQTFNLDPSHTPWKNRLEPLLQTGVRAGADLVEVFLERTDHLGVLAEQERITSVSPSFGMGAGIRVFMGHRDGFVSTNDLSESGLAQALDQALAMLELEHNALQHERGFEGLRQLRDFGANKDTWLAQSPELSEITHIYCL